MTDAAGRHRHRQSRRHHVVRRLSFAAGKRRGPWGALVHAVSDHLDMGYKRRTIILLLLVFVVDYADRTLIGALGPTLKSVFHLDNTGLGALGAAFGVVGALATIPLGVLTDRVKRTLLLAISLAIWAVASAATGAAISMLMLFGARLLLGVVTATTGPTVPSLVGDLVPAARRARALGIVGSGPLLGSGVGFLLAAVVTAFLSFRWCFWLLAIAGAALALAFWRLPEPARTGAVGPGRDDAREDHPPDRHTPNRHTPDRHAPDRHAPDGHGPSRIRQLVQEKGIAPRQRAVLACDPHDMSMWEAARYVVRVRTDLIVLVARAAGDYFLAATGTFGVVYATAHYHLSQQMADLAILGQGLGALAGVLVVGRVADRLLRRGWLNSRVWIGALGHLLAPLPLLPAFLTHTVAIALPLFALGAFLLAGAQPPLDAVRVDVVVPRLRGRSEAIRQVLRTAAEGGAPLIFGLIAGRVGGDSAGLELAFLLTLPLLLANGLVLLIALKTYAPDVAAALASDQRYPAAERPDNNT